MLFRSNQAEALERLNEEQEAYRKLVEGIREDICRGHGISSATFYKWRSKYGGLDVSMMSRLKELEAENNRLKKMYAEERLNAEILKEALEKKW